MALEMKKDLVNMQTVNALLQFAVVFTLIGFLIPLANISLRVIDFPLLQKITPGHSVMNPLAATCIALIAIALWLVRNESETTDIFSLKTISKSLCILVIAVCLGRIVFTLFGWPFLLDDMLFSSQLKVPEHLNLDTKYNTLGINTALCLAILAISIIYIDSKNPWVYANPQSLNYVVIFISILTIYGYVYSVEDLYNTLGSIPMKFFSAVSLMLLASAVLFFRPYQGTMAHLVGQNPTRVFLMRFLAFIVPLLIGYIKIKGQENDLYNEEFGSAIVATTTYLISMTLLGWKTTIQYKLQVARVDKFRTIKEDRKRMNQILNGSQTHIQILDLTKDQFVFSNYVAKDSSEDRKQIEKIKYSVLIKEITHPDDLTLLEERLDRLKKLKKDEHDDQIFRSINKNGEVSWIFSRAIVFKKIDEKPIQILFNSVDITKEKELEEKLQNKKKELEEKQKKLEEARNDLKNTNKKLENKAKDQAKELAKTEKAYHDYIKNSFDGIIQYSFKDEPIDIEQNDEEIITQIKKRAYIEEANTAAAKNLGYDDPEELKDMYFIEQKKNTAQKIVDENIKELIQNNFRLYGLKPIVAVKEGKKIKLYINVLGIIKDKKLTKIWEIQSNRRIKKLD
jgi:PAS domain-containing protein